MVFVKWTSGMNSNWGQSLLNSASLGGRCALWLNPLSKAPHVCFPLKKWAISYDPPVIRQRACTFLKKRETRADGLWSVGGRRMARLTGESAHQGLNVRSAVLRRGCAHSLSLPLFSHLQNGWRPYPRLAVLCPHYAVATLSLFFATLRCPCTKQCCSLSAAATVFPRWNYESPPSPVHSKRRK